MNVSVLVFNTFVTDSRVLKIIRFLSQELRANVKLYALRDRKRTLPKSEVVHGVRIERLELFSQKFGYGNVFSKSLNYLEFWWRVLSRLEPQDLTYCNDLNTLPIGVLAKAFKRSKKVLYDSHEYQRETIGRDGLKKWMVTVTERSLIPLSDAVLVVSPSIAEEYQRIYKMDKPTVVMNSLSSRDAPDSSILRESLKIDPEHKLFLFQGGVSEGRGGRQMLEAFKRLREPYHLVVMGKGDLMPLVEEYASICSNIHLHPLVPFDEVLNYTASADAGILFYENTCLNHYYCMPNKLFEYMAAEIPLVTSPLYELKRVIPEYGIGTVAENFSVEALMDAVRGIESKSVYKQNLQKAKQDFDWSQQLDALRSVLDKVMLEQK